MRYSRRRKILRPSLLAMLAWLGCGQPERPGQLVGPVFAAPVSPGPGAGPVTTPTFVPVAPTAGAGPMDPPSSEAPAPTPMPAPTFDAGLPAAEVDAGAAPTAPLDAGANSPSLDASAPRTPTFHVFLLLGQSNMEGYPKAQAADRVEDERVRVLGYDDCDRTGRKRDAWDTAAPPLHSCWNDGLGPGDYFAKTLLQVLKEGDTIGLVPCAINGERIETFMKVGGSRYDWIVERARMAQAAGGVIAGMIFHQGESNNGDASWPGKVKTLVEDLRADLGLGPVPFIAGELLYSGSGSRHNPLVNLLPGLIDNAFVVSAEGLTLDPSDTQWKLHFSHDSVVTQGKRYGETMREALAW